MMTLEIPYAKEKMFDISKKVAMGKLPELVNNVETLYPNVVKIWKIMVAYEANDRPNVDELMQQVEHLICGGGGDEHVN